MAVTNVNFEKYQKIEIYDTTENLIGRSEIQGDNDRDIHVTAPIGMDGLKILEPGQKIICVYYHDSKGYRFATKVTDRFVNMIKIFVLKKPEKYEIIQRRQSVRVDHSIPLQYAIITEVEKDYIIAMGDYKNAVKEEFGPRFSKARTYNISAGGLGIYTSDEIAKVGDYIIVRTNLDGKEVIMLMQVIKVSRDDLKGGPLARKVGVRLIHGERDLEERMFQYLFKVMREQSFVKGHE